MPNTTERYLTKKIQWFEDYDPTTGSDDADNDVDEREIAKAEIDHHARTEELFELRYFNHFLSRTNFQLALNE